MEPEIEKCLELWEEKVNDETDALLAWLYEKDPIKREVLLLVYRKVNRRQRELGNRLQELTNKIWQKQ